MTWGTSLHLSQNEETGIDSEDSEGKADGSTKAPVDQESFVIVTLK